MRRWSLSPLGRTSSSGLVLMSFDSRRTGISWRSTIVLLALGLGLGLPTVAAGQQTVPMKLVTLKADAPAEAGQDHCVATERGETFVVGKVAIRWHRTLGPEAPPATARLLERFRQVSAAGLTGETVEPAAKSEVEALRAGAQGIRIPAERIHTMFGAVGADGRISNVCATGGDATVAKMVAAADGEER